MATSFSISESSVDRGIPHGYETESIRVEMLPDPVIAAAATAGPAWRVFGERILQVTKQRCPDSRSGGGASGDAGLSGKSNNEHLRESMEVRFVAGVDPRILIGSAQAASDGGPNKLVLVLEGTEDHVIEGNPVLAFEWKGEPVFFARVNHPGTDPNPFVQEAMKQVVHEYGGVTAS